MPTAAATVARAQWRAVPTPEREVAETTRLLRAIAEGDASAADRLLPRVYDELRRLAGRLMDGERAGHTLQATALLHEAFLRLSAPGASFVDRGHFLGVAATAMRRVLIDPARARAAHKRGGGGRVDLDADALGAPDDPATLLAVDEALARLAAVDAQLGRLVELRFFGGLDHGETAAALGISLRSVERGWRTARAFLLRELDPDGAAP